jgi:hypothetical protein
MRKPAPGRVRLLLFAALLAGALGLWGLLRQRTGSSHPHFPLAAMAESTVAADRAKDWVGVLHWARLMSAAEPSNPTLLLLLALAWHNHAFEGAKYGRVRSATRTSLERIEMESRALALIDSAAVGTKSDEQWARAVSLGGQVYENLGLPIDALQCYSTVRGRMPDYAPVLPRVAFVAMSLRDPLTLPATSTGPSPAAPDTILR